MKIEIDVPVKEGYDVAVVGGGPAGCAAALAAARCGARTILLEGTGQLGGMGTSGLVPIWAPFSNGREFVYGGLALRVLAEAGGSQACANPEGVAWLPINHERLKRVYDSLLAEAGVEVLLHSSASQALMAGNGHLERVIVANKAGLSALRAKAYVDASGDGDLAALAGASFEKGSPNGELMPASLCFVMSGVDTDSLPEGPFHGDLAKLLLESGRFPRIKDLHFCVSLVGAGTLGFNAGHLWRADNTDPSSVSAAMREGRLLAADFANAIAEFHPKAFGKAYLVSTASLLGARNSRRIECDYRLNAEDYWARRGFPDEIARNCYPIDIHNSDKDLDNVKSAFFKGYGPGESHGVPYRCLTPKGLSNVLVAGRCISTDHVVQSSIRVMPSCLVLGEAAGAAAALAAKASLVDVHALDIDELRGHLKACGAFIS